MPKSSSSTPLVNAQPAVVIVSADPESVVDLVKDLEMQNYEVTVVKDATRALNIHSLKPNHWKPSLFIADLVMPAGSGFVLAKQLIEKYPDGKTPVFLMWQHVAPEDVIEAQQVGVIALLQKPLRFEQLSASMEKEKLRRLKAESMEAQFKINP